MQYGIPILTNRVSRPNEPWGKIKQDLTPNSLYNPSCHATPDKDTLLLGLEVVENDGALGRLLTPVLDDNTRAVDDLAGVTLTVKDT